MHHITWKLLGYIHIENTEAAIRLIQQKKDGNKYLNYIDSRGYTILMAACESRNIDIVSALIEHGANISLASYNGLTALDIASYKGYKDIVARIVSEYIDKDFTLINFNIADPVSNFLIKSKSVCELKKIKDWAQKNGHINLLQNVNVAIEREIIARRCVILCFSKMGVTADIAQLISRHSLR